MTKEIVQGRSFLYYSNGHLMLAEASYCDCGQLTTVNATETSLDARCVYPLVSSEPSEIVSMDEDTGAVKCTSCSQGA